MRITIHVILLILILSPSSLLASSNLESHPNNNQNPQGHQRECNDLGQNNNRHPDNGVSADPTISSGHNNNRHPDNAVPVDPTIASVCSRTKYPDVCISSVRSDHAVNSVASVLSSLTHAILAYTTSTRDEAGHVATAGEFVGTAAQVVNDCKESYEDAMHKLEEAIAAIERKDKASAHVSIRDAMQKYSTCQRGGMELPGGGPLAQRDALLEKMADNCLEILELI